MFLRIDSDGRVSGVSSDSDSLTVYEGSKVIDVGTTKFPEKKVFKSIEIQIMDGDGNLTTDVVNEELTVTLESDPNEFSKEEVCEFIKQARAKAILDQYLGEDGFITKLRNTGLTLLVNGVSAAGIKTQIAAKTLEMQNKMKEV